MDIPQELKEEIEKITIGQKQSKIIEDAQLISKKYRENQGEGKKLVTKSSEALAYAISRMPATYCAVHLALSQSLKRYDKNIKSVLDVGAGTGTATWAVNNLIDVDRITCLERENEMRKLGIQLMKDNILNAEWKSFDLTKDEIQDKADLVIASYIINELTEDDRKDAITKLWDAITGMLLIIEPGTPEGFKHILEARNILLEQGANIVAPCTHNKKCEISKDDWCSFYVRVTRSGIQRQAKKGELGYEDEKFSYIAVSRTLVKQENAILLRHPQIATGHVKVKLCTKNGIEEKIYSKKDKEIYKKAKKLDAGDAI